MSSCRTALKDGRYTWRHDQVLREIAAALELQRRRKKKIEKGPKFISFVKGGTETTKSNSTASGILSTANDWEMQADVGGKTTFPGEVLTTTLRPDIVLWSRSSRQVILLELTVPWETRLEEAHERELTKYGPVGNRHPEQELESVVFPGRSRLQRICGTVPLESVGVPRTYWTREEKLGGKSRKTGRDGVRMDLEEER